MNILVKLAELANAFDKKGLFDEAAVLDQIVREGAAVDQLDKVYGKQFGEELLDRVYFSGNLTTIEKAIKKEVAAGTGLQALMEKVERWDGAMPDANGEMRKVLDEFGEKKIEIATGRQTPADQGVAGETDPKVNPRVKAFQAKYNQLRKQLFVKKIMGKDEVKAAFPWIKPDGKWGPATKKAKGLMPALKQKLQEGVASQTQQREQTQTYDATQKQETVLNQQKEQQLVQTIKQIQQAYQQERLRRPQEVPAGQEAKIEEMMRNMTSAQGGMDLAGAQEAVAKQLKL